MDFHNWVTATNRDFSRCQYCQQGNLDRETEAPFPLLVSAAFHGPFLCCQDAFVANKDLLDNWCNLALSGAACCTVLSVFSILE